MSNKKTLLKESTIRRFMTLASIGPLTETFVDKFPGEEELEEGEEGLEDLEGEEEEGETPELEKEPLPPMGGEEEVATTEVPLTSGVPLEAVEDFVEGLVGLAQEKLGPHGLEIESVPSEEEVGLEEPLGLEPEGEKGLEEPLGLEPEGELEEPEEEVGGLPPGPGNRMYEEMDEDAINEIVSRVLSRVDEKKEQENLVDRLADNIATKVFKSTKK